GNFKIEDFSAKLPRYGININKVNTEVDLNKRLVEINNFDGYINNGKIKMEGYLKIPTIAEIRTKEILSKLDYELSLKLDSVDYSYEDKINLVFSANALFAKNKITGEFIVDSGEILDIPEVDEGEISNLASQIKEKEVIKKSRELGKAFEIKTSIKESNSIDLDIKLKTKEPINLNINKLEVTSVVEDIKGNLIIDGNLKLKDDEISYNGILSIEDGSIKLNSNLFYLTTATVNFRKTETESVEFKPLITLNANSTIANEEVYINIDGEYPDLEIQMSSGSGLSEDDIGSLITFHNVNDDESNSNNAVKDVIDRESGKLFSPISSEIASVLKIDKFKISSDLVASEYQAGVYKDTGSLGLGASVEAENPIYKEKLYWRAKARWGTSKYYSNVTEYDFSVIHRITEHLSWGLGVGKIPEGRKTHGETLINNHIDLTWRKKYKSLEDVLLSLLLLGGEE
ncbi:MAG: translocation/assembly module TamB domain-containing protein, partial [Psychrilyobacter sp.]|nr:translocation/assembly module TamB domain-containing protein [Psychrilyobacter sp.]